MRIILLFLFSFCVNFLIAQEEDEKVYQIVQQKPEFPQGEKAMLNFLSSNVKYPEEAKKNKIEGNVVVRFVVRKSGKVDKIEVLRRIGGGCDEEAIRVIAAMPDWIPGKNNGVPVNVSYTLPVRFKLQE